MSVELYARHEAVSKLSNTPIKKNMIITGKYALKVLKR